MQQSMTDNLQFTKLSQTKRVKVTDQSLKLSILQMKDTRIIGAENRVAFM